MPEKPFILLIEDNPDDEALALMALKKCGVDNHVEVKRNGEEALEFLTAHREGSWRLPALILLDLKIPKVDGLELLQQIRSSDSHSLVPVVVLTTSNQAEDITRSYSFGANSYVRKPVSFDEFEESVRHLGHYWLTINERVQQSI